MATAISDPFVAPAAQASTSDFPWTPVLLVGGALLLLNSDFLKGVGGLFGGVGKGVTDIAEPVGDIVASGGDFIDDVLDVAGDIVDTAWDVTKCILTFGFDC